MPTPAPKVFISYSWSSDRHQDQVRQWAEQLVQDGVDVVLDLFDLKEGHDKYAFMERMVTDSSVTHVLVMCDSVYAAKADAREAGVGTETQIISKEIYDKVAQSKFVPIVCEIGQGGEPCLPTFLKSRIWLDFSSPEAANNGWERLIRLLFGKPAFAKPSLGTAPAYVTEEAIGPRGLGNAKYVALRQSILQGKQGRATYRADFLEACFQFADDLRTRKEPSGPWGEEVLAKCGQLKQVRNQIIDWVLLESSIPDRQDFGDALQGYLETLLELKSRPRELRSWSESWFDPHVFYARESFLYVVAALIKTSSFDLLRDVFAGSYLLPESERREDHAFGNFENFAGEVSSLQVLAPEGRTYHSPSAELIKRQADRKDIPFAALMEADLLALLVALVSQGSYWYPGTLLYAAYGNDFPLFLRATQHKHFKKLALVTGIETGDALRQAAKSGFEQLRTFGWHNFSGNFWAQLNLKNLDTLG